MLVKVTECKPSLLHMLPQFVFLLVYVTFIFSLIKFLPLVSLEKGWQSTPAQTEHQRKQGAKTDWTELEKQM